MNVWRFSGTDSSVMCAPRQIAVQPSALADDGSGRAASVAVSGGNKAKLKKGVALLKDLRLSAEEPGTYLICITSASRKARVGFMLRF